VTCDNNSNTVCDGQTHHQVQRYHRELNHHHRVGPRGDGYATHWPW
jgi:hypothetical protein